MKTKDFVEQKSEEDKTLKPKNEKTDFTELQNKFVPSKIENRQMKLTTKKTGSYRRRNYQIQIT